MQWRNQFNKSCAAGCVSLLHFPVLNWEEWHPLCFSAAPACSTSGLGGVSGYLNYTHNYPDLYKQPLKKIKKNPAPWTPPLFKPISFKPRGHQQCQTRTDTSILMLGLNFSMGTSVSARLQAAGRCHVNGSICYSVQLYSIKWLLRNVRAQKQSLLQWKLNAFSELIYRPFLFIYFWIFLPFSQAICGDPGSMCSVSRQSGPQLVLVSMCVRLYVFFFFFFLIIDCNEMSREENNPGLTA